MKMENHKGFKYRLLCTWDHSTNWDLNQPGQQESGCCNPYLRPPEAFLSDYRTLIDFMAEQGFNGLSIWRLFRDAHGGTAAVQELCRYARKQGVRILAGVGVMAYGGVYYEGDHEYSMAHWLTKYPEMTAINEKGKPYNYQHIPPDGPRMQVLCPSREENVTWYQQAIKWLVEDFDVGGIHYECGDYGVCHCPLCKEKQAGVNILSPGKQTDKINVSFDIMADVYPLLMETANSLRPDLWQIYPPYSGYKRDMAGRVRRFLKSIPDYAICQWTLTHMLDEQHEFPWEDDLRFAAAHNVGCFHQGSPWFAELGGSGKGRYDSIVDVIQRAAYKGIRGGLEGLFLGGDVSASQRAWKQNYSALSYFCRHPESSIEQYQRHCEGGEDTSAE